MWCIGLAGCARTLGNHYSAFNDGIINPQNISLLHTHILYSTQARRLAACKLESASLLTSSFIGMRRRPYNPSSLSATGEPCADATQHKEGIMRKCCVASRSGSSPRGCHAGVPYRIPAG